MKTIYVSARSHIWHHWRPASHPSAAAEPCFQVKPMTAEQAAEYKLDTAFYKKCTLVQDILIATSEKVGDVVHLEAAYLFDKVMQDLKPQIAQRIRDKKVLCVLVGHAELVSDLPQYATDKTGKELDFYNWRNRGSLSTPKWPPHRALRRGGRDGIRGRHAARKHSHSRVRPRHRRRGLRQGACTNAWARLSSTPRKKGSITTAMPPRSSGG